MYIIADIGSNWRTKEDCLQSIFYAHKAGADAVKFQYFSHEKLYGFKSKMFPGSLQRDWIAHLHKKAIAHGIDFMVTPFHDKDVKFLNRYVDRWKISSSDITYYPLLEAVGETGKQIILSCGASNDENIRRALEVLKDNDVILLYCVSSYPSVEDDYFYIKYLADKYGVQTGYSDHTLQVYNGLLMCDLMGGVVYEKHFKIADMKSPDNGHSLDYLSFSRMTMRYHGDFKPYQMKNFGEDDMYKYHNRRLVVTKDIKRGDIFKYGTNFGYYRSTIKCDYSYEVDRKVVDGRKSTCFISAGSSICGGDFV